MKQLLLLPFLFITVISFGQHLPLSKFIANLPSLIKYQSASNSDTKPLETSIEFHHLNDDEKLMILKIENENIFLYGTGDRSGNKGFYILKKEFLEDETKYTTTRNPDRERMYVFHLSKDEGKCLLDEYYSSGEKGETHILKQ